MGNKIILFELNEVPFQTIDRFVEKYPESCLAQLLPRSSQWTTRTTDVGHLSPWITWPTLHRGVDNTQHGIKDIGENVDEQNRRFPPLWEILASNEIDTGVFGSLHTYPLPEAVKKFSFYIPDTFASGPECFPDYLNSFQNLNLVMARRSARNVDSGIPVREAVDLARSLPKLGLKFSTIADVATHLARERVKPMLRVRRRVYQGVLAFDIFMRQLKKHRPQFATFFTNHVASSQHRYWAAAFPEDYSRYECEDWWKEEFKDEIYFAMLKFDAMLAELNKFVEANPGYEIWITSSMGQAATKAVQVESQFFLMKPEKFMQYLEIPAEAWSVRPAMLPQANVFVAESHRDQVRSILETIRVNGEPITFREDDAGMFSMDFGHENVRDDDELLMLDRECLPYADLGFEITRIEDQSTSTAYHIPEGSLIIYSPESKPDLSRRTIESTRLAPTVLRFFDVSPPDYMPDAFA